METKSRWNRFFKNDKANIESTFQALLGMNHSACFKSIKILFRFSVISEFSLSTFLSLTLTKINFVRKFVQDLKRKVSPFKNFILILSIFSIKESRSRELNNFANKKNLDLIYEINDFPILICESDESK